MRELIKVVWFQEIYQQVLILDLEYALDKKVEQDLWSLGFKKYIATLQILAKDKKVSYSLTFNKFVVGQVKGQQTRNQYNIRGRALANLPEKTSLLMQNRMKHKQVQHMRGASGTESCVVVLHLVVYYTPLHKWTPSL